MKPIVDQKIRILLGATIAIGPGKADLLEAIEQTESISAAARQMHMSYRRAWGLVDLMNRCFDEPLVTTSPGGHRGGGAQVTEFGLLVLKSYRDIVDKASAAASQEVNFINEHLKALE